MQNHDWVIEVCEDLKQYAEKHNLTRLESRLKSALVAAKHDILLAKMDAPQHSVAECVVHGAEFGVCRDKVASIHTAKKHTILRCQ